MKKILLTGLPSLVFVLACLQVQLLQAQETAPGDRDQWLALIEETQTLQSELASLEAENEIENLQKIYGFYFDKKLWQHAADLFSDDASVELGGSGVYVGKGRILEYFKSLGSEGPQEGILFDYMQLQPVIHLVSENSAKGRWHLFSQESVFSENHFWGTGIYENEYIKENGVWKISKLKLYSTMRTPYEDGWGKVALPRTTPSSDVPPDESPSSEYENYPAVYVPEFHFEHPVTSSNAINIPVENSDLDESEFSALLLELEARGDRLQDADEVERLHVIYGYYLARNQWDELTGIFTPDGSIEIAMRGVYVGREGIRRNLNLYGVQGELEGQLHNHMQYQPVIHIDEDGDTAYMRSRSFSMMGVYGRSATWGGGVYENVFEKRDGVWMIHTDQIFNTYFVPYATGWKDSTRRSPPGINPNNPPDAQPTVEFEMFPAPFLPPFHYTNPVTGAE